MSEYRPQLLMDMTPDGLRLQILDRENRPMFDMGSAQLQPEMRVILRRLGPLLSRMPNSLSITGHTDARQYATGEREYSNWELSADRANAARRELVVGGMDESKVRRVLGLSSSVNLVEDAYADVNRRISIVVLNRRAERRMDEQDASYATPTDLDDVFGQDSAMQPTIPGWERSAVDGRLVPIGAAPSESAEAAAQPYDGPLTPRTTGSQLVETVIPMTSGTVSP